MRETGMRYRKVQSSEQDNEEEAKKQRAERIEKLNSKLHALFWVLCACGILYATDLPRVAFTDERVNRLSLNLAVVCFTANFGIVLYLTLYLPLIAKVTAPWEVYCPNMIPTATGLGFACVVLLMVAFWPVYGLITPLLIAILLMGFLFVAHFVPWPC